MNTTRRWTTTLARIDDRAAAALVCGVVGLFLFNVVFGPIAIGLGLRSARRNAGEGQSRAALLGIALGLADLVVLAVLVAGKVHGGAFSWIVAG
jgi:flagellar motor component MotA